jgi:hypothetical protein
MKEGLRLGDILYRRDGASLEQAGYVEEIRIKAGERAYVIKPIDEDL